MGVVVPLFAPKPEQGRLPGVEYEPAGPEPVDLTPTEVKHLVRLLERAVAFSDNPQMFTADNKSAFKKAAYTWIGRLLGEEDEVPG
jgi:hypothetical protein